MTLEIAAVLLILAIALVLFVTEKLRMDVVALLVLGTLAVSGMVTLEEALAGFSNPAVVTVWAMFILSAGLSATGVADMIGQRVLALAGTGEVRILMVIMLTAGVLSAFMNNIGVAALMLPVVMDVARRTGTSPSRLLMPMAYASLLGGLTTLIGTPPNLVASTALEQAGYEGFGLFEFTPIGAPALVAGAVFIALIGRHLLPASMPEGMGGDSLRKGLQFSYDLEERRFLLRVASDSPLHGLTLKKAGLSVTLGLNVVRVRRGDDLVTDPGGEFTLASGDVLTAQGRVEDFSEFLSWQALEMASGEDIVELLSLENGAVMTAQVAEGADLVGLTVRETDFQARFGVHILAIRRPGTVIRDALAETRFQTGDILVLEGPLDAFDPLAERSEFAALQDVDSEHLADIYQHSQLLIELIIPPESQLAGSTVEESGLGESLRLRIIGIARRSGSVYFPAADEKFQAGDQLLAIGHPESFELIRAIQSLELLENEPAEGDETPDREGLVEVTMSPRSSLPGRSMREIGFRQRYGLLVLSIAPVAAL